MFLFFLDSRSFPSHLDCNGFWFHVYLCGRIIHHRNAWRSIFGCCSRWRRTFGLHHMPSLHRLGGIHEHYPQRRHLWRMVLDLSVSSWSDASNWWTGTRFASLKFKNLTTPPGEYCHHGKLVPRKRYLSQCLWIDFPHRCNLLDTRSWSDIWIVDLSSICARQLPNC